jgi:superfamily II DNA/RNA helicase
VPGSAEDYVHRVGRTARADKTGIAISLINEMDMEKFDRIEKLIEMEVLKIPVPPEMGAAPVYKVRPQRKGGRPQARRNTSSGGKPKKY